MAPLTDVIPPLAVADRVLLERLVGGDEIEMAEGPLATHDDVLRTLLPLVAQGLRGDAVSAPSTGTTAIAFEETTARNQILHEEVSRLAADLGDHEVGTVVVGDLALAVGYYGDVGLRPVVDADLLVPVDAVEIAIEVVERSGWHLDGAIDASVLAAAGESASLTNASHPAQHLRLVWRAAADDHRGAADAQLLRADGHLSGSRLPSASDLLVLVAANAARLAEPSLQWRVDLCVLLASGSVDAGAVVAGGRQRGLGPMLAAALATYARGRRR